MSGMMIEELDRASEDAVVESLRACCGSESWCRAMASRRPFCDLANLHRIADLAFDSLTRQDWLEAFSFHPKIGDLDSLRMKFAGNREWSSLEQAGILDSDEETIRQLAERNGRYQAKFGYIFIVCASGQTATEMLALLEARLQNTDKEEFIIAAAEQRKITHLRIDKLVTATVFGHEPERK